VKRKEKGKNESQMTWRWGWGLARNGQGVLGAISVSTEQI
jgi:hypothetical protein